MLKKCPACFKKFNAKSKTETLCPGCERKMIDRYGHGSDGVVKTNEGTQENPTMSTKTTAKKSAAKKTGSKDKNAATRKRLADKAPKSAEPELFAGVDGEDGVDGVAGVDDEDPPAVAQSNETPAEDADEDADEDVTDETPAEDADEEDEEDEEEETAAGAPDEETAKKMKNPRLAAKRIRLTLVRLNRFDWEALEVPGIMGAFALLNNAASTLEKREPRKGRSPKIKINSKVQVAKKSRAKYLELFEAEELANLTVKAIANRNVKCESATGSTMLFPLNVLEAQSVDAQ